MLVERVDLERLLTYIYNSWHGCALSRKEALQMDLPEGRLCDVCHEQVQEQIKTLEEKSKSLSKLIMGSRL